jgi:hypothetical membrane protein
MTISKLNASRSVLLLGPIWFCVVIIFAGAFTPGYSHGFQAVSELAAPNAPYAWLVRFGGFVPLGLAFVLFAFLARQNLVPGAFRNTVFFLFAITGLAICAAGIFPTDVHGRRNTFSGMAHAIAGIILLASICATPLLIALTGIWRTRSAAFKIYSIISACILITLFALLPNGISPALIQFQKIILGNLFTVWYKYQGLDQRVLLLVYFLWLFIFVRFFMLETLAENYDH